MIRKHSKKMIGMYHILGINGRKTGEQALLMICAEFS